MTEPNSAAALAACHGGLRYHELERLGLSAELVLDVSVNVNPYGPCPALREAIAAAALDRYPDPTAAPAQAALARWQKVAAEQVVVGNGAVDLLWSLARCALRPGDRVLIVEPAFSELRRAALVMAAHVVEHRLRAEEDFALDVGALDAALRAAAPQLAYLCSPANPTGKVTATALVRDLAQRHPATLFIIDASFASLSSQPDEDHRSAGPLVWLCSLTKDLGLAGLRVGFAVAPPALVSAIEATRPPWSVNALAQAACVAAPSLAARAFVASSRRQLLADRAALDDGLRRLGLSPHPSETLFSLVDLGPGRRASALRAALLARHAVLVRDATSFGLPRHVRLCAVPATRLPRLLGALSQELSR